MSNVFCEARTPLSSECCNPSRKYFYVCCRKLAGKEVWEFRREIRNVIGTSVAQATTPEKIMAGSAE
jgi:hypothetical protein